MELAAIPVKTTLIFHHGGDNRELIGVNIKMEIEKQKCFSIFLFSFVIPVIRVYFIGSFKSYLLTMPWYVTDGGHDSSYVPHMVSEFK